MAKQSPDYVQTINPQGYINNREITNLPAVYLVKGSRDCVVVNKEKVASRKGYGLVGVAKTKNFGHRSSFDWETNRNLTHSLRLNLDGDLQVWYLAAWRTLKTYNDDTRANFAPWWSSTELQDLLLFVVGTADVEMWSGGAAILASNDATTITLASGTWAQSGFLTAGTRKVLINGVEYAYTGGEATDTLTGLTGLPTFAANTVVLQAVRTSSPSTLSGAVLSLISVYNNHVFFGDLTSRVVNMSQSSDYATFTKSSPRAPGEGEVFTFDSTPTAFVPAASGENFGVFGRKDDYFELTFTLSADNGAEAITVKKLPTATGQAARSQASVVRIKNGVAFLNFEPTIDTLSRILNINSPSSVPISDPIRDDLGVYDLTDAHGLFFQNQIFFALPAEGIVIIYDLQEQCWQPPHFIPVGRLALIDIDEDGTQKLCGHSSVSNETYELYTGYSDNGAPIHIEMHFGYENNGTRFTQKTADEFASELYMSENTKVTSRIYFDYKGASGVREFEIDGADDAIRFSPMQGAGFGQTPFGSEPFGSLATSIEDLSKYRVVDTTALLDYFERSRAFIAEGVDVRFAVIAYGDNVELSDNIPASIKR